MSQMQTAAATDRLPWLADEPAPPTRRGRSREIAAVAIAATAAAVAVAGLSYWMRAQSSRTSPQEVQSSRPAPAEPVARSRPAEPSQPQVALGPQPQVTPVVQRDLPIARPHGENRIAPRSMGATPKHEPAPPIAEANTAAPAGSPSPSQVVNAAPAVAQRPLALWPAWQSQGAYGRIVRIGAFGSRLQAKFGWRYMVRAYPAVAHLPATVVETRNSRGRPFYRFQIGTTSQAHSEVLCQRMKKINLSCAVVGLPWKPKGVER